MIENQRLQKDKKGLGFTEDKASTSKAKTRKIDQESTKMPSMDLAHPVPSEKAPASVSRGYRATVSASDTLKPKFQNRSEFVQITKKTSPSTTVGNTKQPSALKLGQGVGKSNIQTRPKMPLRRPNIVYPKSDYHQVVKLDPDEWIKDSGCTRHITGNKDLFSTYEAIDGDHSREFDNKVKFGAFCDANGITHNFSALRTPQSNGVVKRKNRTLQEMSCTMLNEQSIPQKFGVMPSTPPSTF
ncbi:retrovirus-related pol polyprotein from transposon TNT 1-94 [Tanacetum coccineum]